MPTARTPVGDIFRRELLRYVTHTGTQTRGSTLTLHCQYAGNVQVPARKWIRGSSCVTQDIAVCITGINNHLLHKICRVIPDSLLGLD